MAPESVVVSGVGTVGPWGVGLEPLRRALATGTPQGRPIDRCVGLHRRGSARDAGRLGDVDLTRWLAPATARRMGPPSRFATAAGHMALESAGLDLASIDGDAAVILATTFGSTSASERLLRQVLTEGAGAAQPFLFTESVANAPAAQVAIAIGARGPNVTLTQREAGPLLAIAYAAGAVLDGRATRALAGSVDEVTPFLHAVLDRFQSLARERQGLTEQARPLDRRRNGYLASEGATVWHLETAGTARERGASILAVVRASGACFDPTASASDWGRGEQLVGRALRSGLERRGVPLNSIDRILSGASGSRRGDRLEALALQTAWSGTALPPLSAPLGVTGQYGGGLLAAALLMLDGAGCHPADETFEVDPEIGISPDANADGRPPRRVLVTSFATGGAGAWLVLDRP